MSFSWLLHLLQFPGSAHPFYEHCPYYSKKSKARQEKIFPETRLPSGFVHISTGKFRKFFCKKGIFRFFETGFTISCIQYRLTIFLDKFFVEPVDNFCYTKDKSALSEFHRFHSGSNYVIHNLLITLLITFSNCKKHCECFSQKETTKA